MTYQHPLHYLLGLQGMALMRAYAGEHDRAFAEARVAEIRRLLDTPGLGEGVTAEEIDTVGGYEVWSRTYDNPGNGLYPLEEPFVHEIIDSRPAGTALDADIHHEMRALGSVPHVRTAAGEPRLISGHQHRVGDYLAAALPHGLDLRRCEEPRTGAYRKDAVGAPPETVDAGPWDAWPWALLAIAPAAAAAAWAEIPSVMLLHFRARDGQVPAPPR